MKRRCILFACSLLLCSSTLLAATFPGTDTAGADATVTINAGGGGDYTSLAAAATAFNAMTTGMQRNWTIEIASDLTEAANISIANTTNGNTLTIKPAASTAPTVTFTQLADNAGPSGHLVIGSPLASFSPVVMSNVIIDGSNNGTTSRDLTLINSAATSFPNPRIIRFVGATTDCAVKNCIITNRSTSGQSGFGVDWTQRDGSVPNNNLTENNLITATTGSALQGIGFNTSGAALSGSITGSVIRDNDITARTRGIFLNRNAGCLIEGNIIRVNQPNAGTHSQGINFASTGGANNWTMTIRNNEFLQLATGTNSAGTVGVTAILLDGAGTGSENLVYNNIITGFSRTGTAADDVVRAISQGAVAPNLTVEHNSIYMPNTNSTGVTAGRVTAIGTTAATFSGTLTARNNIILWEDNVGFPIFKANAGGSIVAAGNNVVSTAGANVGSVNATNYADLTAWQGAGYDLTATGGQSVNPTTTSPGAWINKASNLRFAGGAASPMIPVASSTILTDIDGNVRPSTNAWPGSFEQVGVTVPVELDVFGLD